MESNDKPFRSTFPYLAQAHAGDGPCSGELVAPPVAQRIAKPNQSTLKVRPAAAVMSNFPNPFVDQTTVRLHLASAAKVQLVIYDAQGRLVRTVLNERRDAGDYVIALETATWQPGRYTATLVTNGAVAQTLKLIKVR